MEDPLFIIIFTCIGLAIIFYIANQLLGLASYVLLVILIGYITFFTNMGMFIRPFFTSLDEWETQDLNYHYHFVGTGTFINYQHVLTNQHVIKKCKSLKIRTKSGIFDGNLIATDSQWDFAAIATNTTSPIFAVFRKTLHIPKEDIIYPDYTRTAGDFSIKSGNIMTSDQLDNEERQQAKEQNNVFFTGFIRKGNSGSPLYDSKGYLIGLVKSAVIRFDPFYFGESVQIASGLKPLKTFLKQHQIPFAHAKREETDFFKRNKYIQNMAVGVLCGK